MFAAEKAWQAGGLGALLVLAMLCAPVAIAQNDADNTFADSQRFEMESQLLEKLKRALEGPPAADGVESMMNGEAFSEEQPLPEDAVDTLEQDGDF